MNFVLAVNIRVKPENVERFMTALVTNARFELRQPVTSNVRGTLRADDNHR